MKIDRDIYRTEGLYRYRRQDLIELCILYFNFLNTYHKEKWKNFINRYSKQFGVKVPTDIFDESYKEKIDNNIRQIMLSILDNPYQDYYYYVDKSKVFDL